MAESSILIVDDHPLIVGSLKAIVESHGIGRVNGVAVTGEQCIKLVDSTNFDLIMLDINLPDISGIDVCDTIIKKYPQVKIVALTTFNEFTIVRKMLESGAMGYILKNAMPEEIIKGIETVLDGQKFLCHEVDLLMKKKTDKQIFLTTRESDLLKLICDGYTNSEIAEKLFLSVETINTYRKNLLFKLNARNTALLVKMAIEHKLV